MLSQEDPSHLVSLVIIPQESMPPVPCTSSGSTPLGSVPLPLSTTASLLYTWQVGNARVLTPSPEAPKEWLMGAGVSVPLLLGYLYHPA